MTKNNASRFENPVVADNGQTLGWWWLDGDMVTVRSPTGVTKSARRSASNDTLARLMLREPWAN